MSVIQGKFKLPILRGEHSPAITRFQDIDTTLRKDLGHWLCNIYFEVRCMDLLQCSIAQNCRLHSSLSVWQPLSILIPTPLYARQSNNSKIPPREQSAYSSSIRQAQLTSNSRVNRNFVEDVQVRRTMKIKKQCKFRPQPRTFPLAFSFKVHPEESLIPKSITLNTSHDAITHPTDDIFQSLKKAPHPDSKRVTFLTTDNNIDDASEPHQAALQHERSLPSSDDEDSCYNIYHSDSSTTASRVCHENVRTTNSSSNSFQDLNLFSRKDSTSTLSDSPDGVLVTRPWDRLVNPADIALYSPALSSDPARQKSLLPDAIMTSKLRYIYAEIFLDLEFRLFGSIDYFLTLSIYLAAVWTSLYVHYLGQYLFLLVSVSFSSNITLYLLVFDRQISLYFYLLMNIYYYAGNWNSSV